MKKSSMKMAPNGRMPPMRTLNAPPMYHACSGIWRGISLVRTGGSLSVALKPKKAPTKTSGTEMPNHISSSTIIVVKGIAPDEPWLQMKQLSTKKTKAMSPG